MTNLVPPVANFHVRFPPCLYLRSTVSVGANFGSAPMQNITANTLDGAHVTDRTVDSLDKPRLAKSLIPSPSHQTNLILSLDYVQYIRSRPRGTGTLLNSSICVCLTPTDFARIRDLRISTEVRARARVHSPPPRMSETELSVDQLLTLLNNKVRNLSTSVTKDESTVSNE